MNTAKLTRYGSAAGLILVLAGCQSKAEPGAQTRPTLSAEPSSVAAASIAPIPSRTATPAPTIPIPSATPIAPTIAPQAELRYLWPSTLPQGMHIRAVEAAATEEMFVLNVDAPGTQWSAMITGGPSSRAVPPPTTGTQAVTVRGLPGISFSTGAGFSLFWQEGLHQYAILSTLSLEDALAVANGLQSLDQQAWHANFKQLIAAAESVATPSPVPADAPPAPQQAKLHYLWPDNLPQQMQLDGVEATASDDIFVINARAPGTQWYATITGGVTSQAIQLPSRATQEVMVRGHSARAFSTGAGYSLFWQEDGQPYAVFSSLSLDDALALANGLQTLDRETWLTNLQQELEAGS